MATSYDRNVSNPLLLLEIVRMVIDNVHMPPDLLICACVNSTWSEAALKKLYKGSLNDMQFRTPGIGSLNCLFVASRERFRRNIGFVKHLLLSSDRSVYDAAVFPDFRPRCIERCLAMRDRESAEFLLRPRGGGLASLTIPFEMEGQDSSLISDLLLPRTNQFLAIDGYYCGLLMASSKFPQELTNPNDRFLNLKALTIYPTSSHLDIDKLCGLLKMCDLEFFHLEEPEGANNLTQYDIVELLSSLRRQENLKALALLIPRRAPLLESASMMLEGEEQRIPWPSLKLLSLGFGDQHWQEQFPKFEKLQILSVRRFDFVTPLTSHDIQNITKCRHLRVIDIDEVEVGDAESLLDLARGCPLLQKLSMRKFYLGEGTELPENLCIRLLRALPRLEHFEMGLMVRIDGASFQNLAHYCPQLIILALPGARLCLSRTQLTEAYPFQQLQSMRFREIFFENPRLSMSWDKIRGIAADWRRIFPKLRGMPCELDSYFMPVFDFDEFMKGDRAIMEVDEEMSDLDEGPEGDSMSADEEMSPSEPQLGFEDYRSDWYIVRRRLWKVLGYLFIHEPIQYVWQKNLEIETVGWPVVPLAAFSDPDLHSTTARSSRWTGGVDCMTAELDWFYVEANQERRTYLEGEC